MLKAFLRPAKTAAIRCLFRIFPRFEAFREFPRETKPRYGWGLAPHPLLQRAFEEKRSRFTSYLQSFLNYKNDLLRIPRTLTAQDSVDPAWDNNMFPALDAIALYGLLCTHRPRILQPIWAAPAMAGAAAYGASFWARLTAPQISQTIF